jgi:hypothetical protein
VESTTGAEEGSTGCSIVSPESRETERHARIPAAKRPQAARRIGMRDRMEEGR